ncbi:hypothetical protein Bca101_074719 [Brassica carinata]
MRLFLKELKTYISELPVLSKPIIGETLFLYVVTSEHAVSGVMICEESGEQKPIYYVSRSLVDTETRYPVMEKLALAVITAARKLRPYFQSHPIIFMTSQPLRTILHSPSQSGRLAKWAIELSEYDIEYKPRTSSKAQVLADFVIELVPKEDSSRSNTEKWKLHVDGALSKQGSGIGIQLESSTGEIIEQSFCLGFSASNSEAEYESLIAGLLLARSIGAQEISVSATHNWSQDNSTENTKQKMKEWKHTLQSCEKSLSNSTNSSSQRSKGYNTSADALAALASTSNPTIKRIIPVEGIDKPSIDLPCKGINLQGDDPPRIGAITTRSRARRESQDLDDETSGELNNQPTPSTSRVRTRRTATTDTIPEKAVHKTNNEAHEAFRKEFEATPGWRIPIIKYIKDGELPAERWEALKIKAWSSRYCIMEEKLYKRSLDEPYLLGVSPKDAFKILKQTHGGSCGSHSGGRSLAIRIKKLGYFWPTNADDSEQFALKCDKCQRHTPMIHQPTQKLSTISSPYPFMKWSMDVVGPLVPSGPAQLRFLLVLTDYFTKWIEAEAFSNVTSTTVTSFIWKNIICRHGLPYEIVTDNGPQFISKIFNDLCVKWKIKIKAASPDTQNATVMPKLRIKL